jgi:hypothetical protein
MFHIKVPHTIFFSTDYEENWTSSIKYIKNFIEIREGMGQLGQRLLIATEKVWRVW